MAKAYICDRCGQSQQGTSFARVFLERRQEVPAPRGPARVIARCEDLCAPCAGVIQDAIDRNSARKRAAEIGADT